LWPNRGSITAFAWRDCKKHAITQPGYFDVLLTVHLSIFISVFNELDAQNLFQNKFYYMPLHVYETATYRCDDTRGCVMQF